MVVVTFLVHKPNNSRVQPTTIKQLEEMHHKSPKEEPRPAQQSDTEAWLGAAVADVGAAPSPPQESPGLAPDVASIITATTANV